MSPNVYNIIVQSIGFVGTILMFVSFQQNTGKKILLFQILGASVFSVHFFLLGAYTGAILNVISIARNYIFYKKDDYAWAGNKFWFYGFIVIYAIAGAFTWTSFFSIFSIVGIIIGTFGMYAKTPKVTRILMFISIVLWLVYNASSHSISACVSDTLSLSSILVSMIRYDFRGIKETKNV